MHRVLLREVVIDVPRSDLGRAREFWGAVLDSTPCAVDGFDEFVALPGAAASCVVGLQGIAEPEARLHLDLETDDVEAEVARLTRLGAVEVRRVRGWVVMRDPMGLLVCVTEPESDDFETRSHSVE